jgi:hypothetical protein
MIRHFASFLAFFLLFIGAFVASERAFSPAFQQCIAAHENNNDGGSAEKNPSLFGVTIDRYVRCSGEFIEANKEAITALATVIIAAFTGTLWVATSRQARLTIEAIRLAREEFIATHRPRVIVRFIQGGNETSVVVVNIGASLAKIKEFGGDLARYKGNTCLTPGADGAVKPIKTVNLKSGESHPFRVIAKKSRSEDDMFLNAVDAQAPIKTCAFGAIRYSDKNGVVRETGFFRTLDPASEKFIPSEDKGEEYQD